MNIVATILFPVGAVAIAIAFAAHVGHAVLLANGRRSLSFALGSAPAPAWAGAVSGSFADARLAAAERDRPTRRSGSPRPRSGAPPARSPGSGSRRSSAIS